MPIELIKIHLNISIYVFCPVQCLLKTGRPTDKLDNNPEGWIFDFMVHSTQNYDFFDVTTDEIAPQSESKKITPWIARG